MSREITIVCDTGEKWTQDKYAERLRPDVMIHAPNVELIMEPLDVGDYTLEGYRRLLCVEFKRSVNELAGNFFTKEGRRRFAAMWDRAENHLMRRLLIVGSWEDITRHNYRSKADPDKFKRTLFSWSLKYHFEFDFVDDWGMAQEYIIGWCEQFDRIMEEDIQDGKKGKRSVSKKG